ncbi:MAG: tRNA dihydrouridine synthase DusB [Planctomycetota bacterium]
MSDSKAQKSRLGYSIGPHRFEHGLSLAPMAGNTNLAYRRLCRRFGAELTTTEMVSSMALHHNDEKTLTFLERGDDEQPVAAQLFGADPEILANAARKVQERGFHIVDLNIGCPVPKITGGGGGSALLREPELAERCIAAMNDATDIPVTVKMRAGWDEQDRSAPEFAKRMEQAGAAGLTVHGRTREQKYMGHADLDVIHAISEAISIPVVGNGDVVDLKSAARMAETGVAGIAIGRGALGRPWLFEQTRAMFAGDVIPEDPNLETRAQLLLELGAGVCSIYGEHRGMRIMRRLATDFFRGIPGAPTMRKASHALESMTDLEALAARISTSASIDPNQLNLDDFRPS